ncbi:MAG: hypothetical protein Q8L90_10780 [Bacteroidota bacterium]|nr:hypothetical protein [Bacteroidota bacterium]
MDLEKYDDKRNVDPAFEYYKTVTNSEFIEKFQSDSCLSGLTKNELLYGGIFEKNDRKQYTSEPEVSFVVEGKTYDEKVNSFLRFKYSFHNINDAEKYYELMMNSFSLIKIKIYKKTWQEIRCFS